MATSDPTDKKLYQKVAIIRGASSGIGRATAVLFSRLGAKLALTGRNQENLTKSAEECEAVSPYNLKRGSKIKWFLFITGSWCLSLPINISSLVLY
ncbi:putative oxidoreductase Lin0452 isoform X1 [Tachypleus tridentatus]|uniref:putative oxidoreductase Lin0452 isoform X1 n=1 Tax=Tachypleus tridentatus TaxID=6853 RepID=UPI003FD3FACD